jgi:hypothetical protein
MRERPRLALDRSLARRRVELDIGRFELGEVVLEAEDAERLRRQEPVAARDVAGDDAVDFERHDLELPGGERQHGEDRLQRPHPAQGSAAPAHRFRPGKAADDVRHELGDHLDRAAAAALGDGEQGGGSAFAACLEPHAVELQHGARREGRGADRVFRR